MPCEKCLETRRKVLAAFGIKTKGPTHVPGAPPGTPPMPTKIGDLDVTVLDLSRAHQYEVFERFLPLLDGVDAKSAIGAAGNVVIYALGAVCKTRADAERLIGEFSQTLRDGLLAQYDESGATRLSLPGAASEDYDANYFKTFWPVE